MDDISLNEAEHISLCEAIDRILNKGAVVVGEVTISVANIDLIYLGVQLIVTSIETAREVMPQEGDPAAFKVALMGAGGLKNEFT